MEMCFMVPEVSKHKIYFPAGIFDTSKWNRPFETVGSNRNICPNVLMRKKVLAWAMSRLNLPFAMGFGTTKPFGASVVKLSVWVTRPQILRLSW